MVGPLSDPTLDDIQCFKFVDDPQPPGFVHVVLAISSFSESISTPFMKNTFETGGLRYNYAAANWVHKPDGLKKLNIYLQSVPASMARGGLRAGEKQREGLKEIFTHVDRIPELVELARQKKWSFIGPDGWALATTSTSPNQIMAEDLYFSLDHSVRLSSEFAIGTADRAEFAKKVARQGALVGVNSEKFRHVSSKFGLVAAHFHTWSHFRTVLSRLDQVEGIGPQAILQLSYNFVTNLAGESNLWQWTVVESALQAAAQDPSLQDVSGVITRMDGEVPEVYVQAAIAGTDTVRFSTSLSTAGTSTSDVVSTLENTPQKGNTTVVVRLRPAK